MSLRPTLGVCDVSKAASLFPARRTRTVAEVGLPETAKDAAIVEKAWELEAIIVTANGDSLRSRQGSRFRLQQSFGLRTRWLRNCHFR
jgi:hypothetical protein